MRNRRRLSLQRRSEKRALHHPQKSPIILQKRHTHASAALSASSRPSGICGARSSSLRARAEKSGKLRTSGTSCDSDRLRGSARRPFRSTWMPLPWIRFQCSRATGRRVRRLAAKVGSLVTCACAVGVEEQEEQEEEYDEQEQEREAVFRGVE